MAAHPIRVELSLDDKGFTYRITRANQTLSELRTNIDRNTRALDGQRSAFRRTLGVMRDFTIVGALVSAAFHNMKSAAISWQNEIIKQNAEVERMTVLMRGLSKETTALGRDQEAKKNVTEIFEIARKLPFEVKTLTDSYVKMRSVGIEPALHTTKVLSDAVANFGGDSSNLHRASIALQQMAGKGVISMEELRQQLGEAVPTAIKQMATAMSMTYGDLVDKISKGQVEAKTALERMIGEMERSMGGAGERMMNTWNGLMARLKTEWTQMAVAIGAGGSDKDGVGGYFNSVKGVLAEMVEMMGHPAMRFWAKEFGADLEAVVLKAREVVGWLIKWRNEIGTAAKWLAMIAGAAILGKLVSGMLSLAAATKVWALASGGGLLANLRSAGGVIAMMVADLRSGQGGFANMRAGAQLLLPAIGALLGPLAAVGGLAYMVYNHFKSARNEMDSLSRRILETRGAGALMEDIPKLKENLEDVNDRFKSLQRYYERVLKLAETDKSITDEDIAEAKAAADAAERRLNSVREQLELARQGVTSGMLAAAATTLQRELDNVRQVSQAKYNEATLLANKELETAKDKQKAELVHRATLREENKKMHETQLGWLREQLALEAAEVKKLEAAKGGNTNVQSPEFQALLRSKGRLQAIKDAITETELASQRLNDSIGGGKYLAPRQGFGEGGGKTAAEQYLSELTNKLESLREQVAKPGNPAFFVELETRLKALQADAKTTPEVIEKIRKAAGELFDQGQLNAQAKLLDQAGDSVAKLRAKLEGTGELSWTQRFIRGDFAQAVPMDPAAYDAMIQKLKELDEQAVSIKAALDVQDEIKRMSSEAQQARRSLLPDGQQMRQELKDQAEVYRAHIATLGTNDEARKRYLEAFYDWQSAKADELARKLETPIQKLARSWEDHTARMQEASTGWITDFSTQMTDMLVDGKANWKGFADAVIKEIIRIMIQKQIAGLVNAAVGFASGLQNTGNGFGYSSTAAAFGAGTEAFAKGGIMTSKGKLPLHAYASGGIARSPQLAVFGEGSRPEAYVPLPDGKTIPVTMAGGGQAPNVTVNVINQSGQNVSAEQGQPKMDGERMVLDVVLKAASQPGAFRENLRGVLR